VANPQPPLLEVAELSVRIGEQLIVDSLSLRVAAGQCLGVVGESGCGKTMTALAMIGLTPEHATVSGSVRLNGQELLGLGEQGLNQLRGRHVAMIFQEPQSALNPVLTVGHQIAEMFIIHERMGRGPAMARAIELLEEVKVSDAHLRARAYPHQLSGGMRQRVMIAMAIACKPALLIADEPTTALDVTVQRDILELILDLGLSRNMGIVFISHNLAVVARIAQHVLVMFDGRGVEFAPTAQALTAPAHPYSADLVASIPVLGGPRDAMVTHSHSRTTFEASIEPPTIIHGDQTNDECGYAHRCQQVRENCLKQRPPLRTLNAHHQVACLYPYGTESAALPVSEPNPEQRLEQSQEQTS
jgi:peptide/nickel transport system ATP-binding protein